MSDAAQQVSAKTFQFELVSPEKILIAEEVSCVVVPGEEGDFGVLAEHAPLLSSIRPGVVVVTTAEGEEKKIFVAGGFADVSGDICSLLAEEAVNLNDLDKEALTQSLTALEDSLAEAKEDGVKSGQIKQQMDILRAKVTAVS